MDSGADDKAMVPPDDNAGSEKPKVVKDLHAISEVPKSQEQDG